MVCSRFFPNVYYCTAFSVFVMAILTAEVEVPATSVGLAGLTPGRQYQAEVKAFNVENRIQGEFQREKCKDPLDN